MEISFFFFVNFFSLFSLDLGYSNDDIPDQKDYLVLVLPDEPLINIQLFYFIKEHLPTNIKAYKKTALDLRIKATHTIQFKSKFVGRLDEYPQQYPIHYQNEYENPFELLNNKHTSRKM